MFAASKTKGVSAVAANYIEDVFSTWLYTGNGSTQTITNGIDLSGKGGLVWLKCRTLSLNHFLYDTTRGATNKLSSNLINAASVYSGLTSFSSSGFNLGSGLDTNETARPYASWTFRKQPKFFDVVTYTGTGSAQNIAHNLGSVPGCIIVKRTDSTSDWFVFHRKNGVANQAVSGFQLNATNAAVENAAPQQSATTFNTGFVLNSSFASPNVSGATYVAYLFAHDAGGFGLTGTDNVISCGSYTGNGSASGPVIDLGYEPQWLLIKNASSSANWQLVDTMRGFSMGDDWPLIPNLSNAETDYQVANPQPTGFQVSTTSFVANTSGNTYIYIAIRRGPMKTPTTGTSVFGLNSRTGTGANATVTGGAGVSDAVLIKNRGAAVGDLFASRLTGTGYLETSSTATEVAAGTTILQANPWDVMDGAKVGTTSTITNASANTYINYLFDRAPGFFDVVCYTGTGSARTVAHNLGVAPELMIFKNRTSATNWAVYHKDLGATQAIYLNGTGTPVTSSAFFNDTAPTSSLINLGFSGTTNDGAANIVAYLFASCPGVSKVGSYTGTGTTQQINCGFTGGARFVLIKRTDSTGDWYVWDTARGMVSGTDPSLLLNSTAAEVNANSVYTTTGGFQIVSTAAGINASGGSYIFLAVS